VNLARSAQQVTIVVRGDSLAARMSQYLIDEISAAPNPDVRTTTQLAAAEGTGKPDDRADRGRGDECGGHGGAGGGHLR
jgi:thioredoxin reductase (NADPH)